jgi:hypothetical protein
MHREAPFVPFLFSRKNRLRCNQGLHAEQWQFVEVVLQGLFPTKPVRKAVAISNQFHQS